MKAGRDLARCVKRMWPLAVIDFNRTTEPAVVVVDNEIGIAIARAHGFSAQRALGTSSALTTRIAQITNKVARRIGLTSSGRGSAATGGTWGIKARMLMTLSCGKQEEKIYAAIIDRRYRFLKQASCVWFSNVSPRPGSLRHEFLHRTGKVRVAQNCATSGDRVRFFGRVYGWRWD